MNHKPALVIMAAGIGSRFGGLKQLAPVGKNGEPIIKFSLYDAMEAGFKKVVFIIKKEIDADFRTLIGDPVSRHMEIEYVYQELDKLPPGFAIPEGRVKPWGTGHAVLCAKDVLDGPFAVINADDYYGKDAFRVIYNRLLTQRDDELYRFSMVGYLIENTLTEHGSVTRGVCQTDGGFLTAIDERLRIEKHGNLIEYTEDDSKTWTKIEPGTIVSMNLWGFTQGILSELETGFPAFLRQALKENPLKGEYLLPRIVNDLVRDNKATVEVLHSKDKWYGITYKEDLPAVAAAIQAMQEEGKYPEVLF
ncbi:MAG TPA: nucleotidyltransferase [Clostridiales bacterium UBA9856]|jgi:dTDP-glucose pyrophosphorylase|nr:nucleotidyltransferase [Clostridiales bacterium UBA9856]HOA41916.1 sugar phosphate nucleotidyltransferase [Bacillota bacterium]HPZ59118.1 sugar phosphate nucleotidyltransferase [Bacillota bacterium]